MRSSLTYIRFSAVTPRSSWNSCAGCDGVREGGRGGSVNTVTAAAPSPTPPRPNPAQIGEHSLQELLDGVALLHLDRAAVPRAVPVTVCDLNQLCLLGGRAEFSASGAEREMRTLPPRRQPLPSWSLSSQSTLRASARGRAFPAPRAVEIPRRSARRRDNCDDNDDDAHHPPLQPQHSPRGLGERMCRQSGP